MSESDGTPEASLPVYQAGPPLNPADERLWSTLIHLGGIFFGFLSPLIGYLVLKDRGQYVREQTATALNFQITLALGYLIGVVTSLIGIGVLLILAVQVLNVVFSIIAAVASNKGAGYRYSLAFSFVR
jgi:uncharacterized Tic20 family protein